jgi:hypothetical protein
MPNQTKPLENARNQITMQLNMPMPSADKSVTQMPSCQPASLRCSAACAVLVQRTVNV